MVPTGPPSTIENVLSLQPTYPMQEAPQALDEYVVHLRNPVSDHFANDAVASSTTMMTWMTWTRAA